MAEPMPIDDIDIYRTAKLILDRHGADAMAEATRRADRFEAVGDAGGAAAWRRVQDAMVVLQKATTDGPLS